MGTAPIDWPNVDAPDWYVPLQEYYKQLWDSGTIDLLVTRFASMGSYFDTHSIRHQYLYPSQETMLETIRICCTSWTPAQCGRRRPAWL